MISWFALGTVTTVQCHMVQHVLAGCSCGEVQERGVVLDTARECAQLDGRSLRLFRPTLCRMRIIPWTLFFFVTSFPFIPLNLSPFPFPLSLTTLPFFFVLSIPLFATWTKYFPAVTLVTQSCALCIKEMEREREGQAMPQNNASPPESNSCLSAAAAARFCSLEMITALTWCKVVVGKVLYLCIDGNKMQWRRRRRRRWGWGIGSEEWEDGVQRERGGPLQQELRHSEYVCCSGVSSDGPHRARQCHHAGRSQMST